LIQSYVLPVEDTLDTVRVFILTHMVEVLSYERCFDGLTGWRWQTQKQRSYEQFSNSRKRSAGTLLRLRCWIEWRQVDAVHRITGIQEVMD
jgi:hypothetical protein